MRRRVKSPIDDAIAFRLGSGALGLLCGLAVGLVCASVGLSLLAAAPPFPRLVFGFGAIGMFIGFVYPASAWAVAEAVVHFLFGFSMSVSDQSVAPSSDSPIWLKVALWGGVGFGLVVMFA